MRVHVVACFMIAHLDLGGTEIGGGFLAGSMLLPNRPGAFSTPTLGSRVVLLTADEDSQSPHTPSARPAVG